VDRRTTVSRRRPWSFGPWSDERSTYARIAGVAGPRRRIDVLRDHLTAVGGQLDIRPVRVSGDRDITDEMVAGYLSKYATKSTEAAGHISRRLDRETIDLYADPNGSHAERLVHACWRLGGYVPGLRLSEQKGRPYAGLRRWAHMLGFGGHFLTKSRRYSITFRILRDNRVVYQRRVESDLTDEHQEETTVVVATLVCAGSGWRSLGDQLLANTSAAMARERRRIGRIETTSIN
jgi:Replication initiator protein, pSAM2